MQKPLLLGRLFGGLVLFAWGAVSWMVLPWHMMTFEKFKDEATVAQVLSANASSPGVYILPNAHQHEPGMTEAQQKAAEEDAMKRGAQGPFMLASITLHGWGSMGTAMLVGLLTQIAGALLATWLLLKAGGLQYWGRVVFLVVFALTVAVLAHVPYWNWWNFSTSYTLVAFADLLIGWGLAGLVIAKVTMSLSPRTQ